jgi:hypothetical protein
MSIQLFQKIGPLYTDSQFKDIKDPCPVFDGEKWHIFGSGGSVIEEHWKILHATAPAMLGPWREESPVILNGLSGVHVAAPGVVYDGGLFHMFVQTDFLATGGTVEYLISNDGVNFYNQGTALHSISDSDEAGIYDPHPAIIGGQKYLVYAATPRIMKTEAFFRSWPDVCLARSQSGTWDGPWERMGKILDHSHIAWHHNQHDHPEYEWGIEGPQLIELPNGKVLLNATCFLPNGKFGTRQRAFFALADTVTGPYITLGPVIDQDLHEWESGENGHAAAILEGFTLYLFYQARSQQNQDHVHHNDWRYGIALFDLSLLIEGT